MNLVERELREEVEELKSRLAEAEETLRAIREGEVDALVVTGKGGERVYTLEGAESSYRLFLEQMGEGAATVTPDGRIIFANRSFAEIFGKGPHDILGKSIDLLIPPGWMVPVHAILEQEKSVPEAIEIRIEGTSGYPKPVRLSFCSIAGDEQHAQSVVAIDLSQREALQEAIRSKEALQESDARFQRALALSRSYAFEWDPKSDRANRSGSCREILAFSGDEAVHDTGQHYLQRVHPDDRARFRQILDSLRQGADTYHTEYRLARQDGKLIVIEETGQAFFSEDGALLRVVGLSTDITERKKVDEERARLAAIVESSSDAIVSKDLSGKIISWNPGAEQMFGYRDEEILGRQITALIPPDRWEEEQQILETIQQGKRITQFDTVRITKEGRQLNVSLTISPIKDASGRVTAASIIMHDITARMRAAKALREAFERTTWLARLPEESPEPILRVASDGTVLYRNPSTEKLPGWACEVGKTLPEGLLPLIAPAMDQGHMRHVDIEMHGRAYAVWVAPIAGEGYANVYGRDITERKNAEEERLKLETRLQQAHKLESLGVLAGGIAHDFNNLLGGLFGYLEIARDYAENGRIDRIGPTLDKATGAMDRARELTRQLITFAKGGEPIRTIAHLEPVLRDVVNLALSGSNVSAQWDIQAELWPCSIDKNQLAQALDNLIVNAKEVMPGGGRIFIQATNVEDEKNLPKELPPGRYVFISIRDEGPGFAKELVDKIYDPFFSTKSTGRGLGLPIAHSIIKRHKGLIRLESSSGHGATFHIYLPASSSELVEEKIPIIKPDEVEGSILLMDDEDVIRDATSLRLEMLGFKVKSARNGEEAIKLYRESLERSQPFDLLLLDLTVRNGMGGKETIKKLLEIDPLVRSVVFSGYHDDPVMSDPAAYGFIASIVKPFSPAELEAVIRKTLKDVPQGIRLAAHA